jgi:hypothetical protein
MNEAPLRLIAARARARQSVLSHERVPLAGLEPVLWRLAGTEDRLCLALAEDLQLHGADVSKLAVARLSEGKAKALVAVLVVTRSPTSNPAHPYPGVAASVGDVLAVSGALGREKAEAPVKGALNKLHGWGLVRLGEHDDELVPAEIGVPVRLGAAAAVWSGPWVAELMTLVARVAEQRGWTR